jgi:glycosyltransferase involved in cell wall biosynthesis
MRASLVIAAHNEGDNLRRTVESCIASSAGLDHELIIVDDASTDGSVAEVTGRFPLARVYQHDARQGVSRTKADGARRARGDVLVFADGHTKPEGDAILRLVRDVEELNGTAIVTPGIAVLDVDQWGNRFNQVGHGSTLDLLTLRSRWVRLDTLRRAEAPLPNALYESPALIGCAFAVGHDLYDQLWGFDPHMRRWGVEDLDFGLKCWLMGHRILHDPGVVVGHRFRTSFDNYTVYVTDVLHNRLRCARKNFTNTVWSHWVEACRLRNPGGASRQSEGWWAQAWNLFEQRRESAEQERSYLHSRRTRDEFWYAERFGFNWPTRLAISQSS